MNARWAWLLLAGIFGLISWTGAGAQGPDDKGAVLRNPFDDPVRPSPSPPPMPVERPNPPPTPQPRKDAGANAPEYLKSIFKEAVIAETAPNRGLAKPDDGPDINRDIQVSPAAGPWLIFIISYPGAEGPKNARKMVEELKTVKRVPAYVFYYGAEERRKEYERVKKIADQQREFFEKSGMTLDEPFRMKFQHIDVQHAVLMGGYPNADAAKRALDQVKRWDPPSEKKVEMDRQFHTQNNMSYIRLVNPFQKAIVCRNPTIKQESPKEDKVADLKLLRQLNAAEQFSLFTCPRPVTLAVKEFPTPFMMHIKDESLANIWDKFGAKTKARDDGAAQSAHNLADTLRKAGLRDQVFVLHSKYSSVVTVGAFDSANDPALVSMQNELATKFGRPEFAMIQFFHRPVPMEVPR